MARPPSWFTVGEPGERRVSSARDELRRRHGHRRATRRNRRSARPTPRRDLSDKRHSSPNTRRTCVDPSTYQARSPAQNPHALPITSGAGEDRYSAAKLPPSGSTGSDPIGRPMLSMNDAAKTTARPDVNTPINEFYRRGRCSTHSSATNEAPSLERCGTKGTAAACYAKPLSLLLLFIVSDDYGEQFSDRGCSEAHMIQFQILLRPARR
jgi:hypothetical protein